MKAKKTLSIVIPAYNEEKIIGRTLRKLVSHLKGKKYHWEIVVSDDGSKDKTAKTVEGFRDPSVRLVGTKDNKGKGAAIRNGIKKAKGNFIIFMDADLSVPITNIDIFWKEFGKGEEVIIASRRVRGAKILVHQPWHREIMGRVFTRLTNVISGVYVTDFTCGFKGFSRKAARLIFKNSLIDRWAYDAEIIFLAKKYGYEIKEVPIVWENREDTRVKLRSVVLETFRDLLKIRLYDFSGKYEKN